MILKKNKLEYDFIEGTLQSHVNLIFIHGSGGDKNSLRALADQLKDYNCYLIDLPGHGGSDNTGYNIENYINSISSFVEDLDNVILIGHSLGGSLALAVSSKKISSVKGSFIISSSAKFTKLNQDFIQKIHKGIVDMNYLMECVGQVTDPVALEALGQMSQEQLIEDFKIAEIMNVESCLKDIDIPTTIITGSDEVIAPVEYSEYIHKNIRNSNLIIIENERHLLPMTKRVEVGQLIKNFATSIDC